MPSKKEKHLLSLTPIRLHIVSVHSHKKRLPYQVQTLKRGADKTAYDVLHPAKRMFTSPNSLHLPSLQACHLITCSLCYLLG
ncbi:hypothetical protein DFQ00_103193 [Paenibacillus barcinonensis]|uniref:Uncharacterized protein n=1 Tax=Paenibacillus barcinonensis TaxID=198119 RepID=A0A2V4WFZ6_PAEBA|nr:hypothetical protein DFQ00_103193 [Paenibacillus barcinonensis]